MLHDETNRRNKGVGSDTNESGWNRMGVCLFMLDQRPIKVGGLITHEFPGDFDAMRCRSVLTGSQLTAYVPSPMQYSRRASLADRLLALECEADFDQAAVDKAW